MKTYTIRTNAHNSAIVSGPADLIIARYEKLLVGSLAKKFRIEDSERNIVTIDDVINEGLDTDDPRPEQPKNNDDKEWPWDVDKKDPDSEFTED